MGLRLKISRKNSGLLSEKRLRPLFVGLPYGYQMPRLGFFPFVVNKISVWASNSVPYPSTRVLWNANNKQQEQIILNYFHHHPNHCSNRYRSESVKLPSRVNTHTVLGLFHNHGIQQQGQCGHSTTGYLRYVKNESFLLPIHHITN